MWHILAILTCAFAFQQRLPHSSPRNLVPIITGIIHPFLGQDPIVGMTPVFTEQEEQQQFSRR